MPSPAWQRSSPVLCLTPTSTGVADIFAFQNDQTVQAVTSDGTTAWTANVGYADGIPDFQGGLVLLDPAANTITKLDGLTGQPYPSYSTGDPSIYLSLPVVHTDGTVFTVQQSLTNETLLIGIDPLTGTQKFSIPLEDQPYIEAPPSDTCSPSTFFSRAIVGSLIVAGDGYAYVGYSYPELARECPGPGEFPIYLSAVHLRILRVNTAGEFDKINIADVPAPYQTNPAPGYDAAVNLITNADTGVLATWGLVFQDGVSSPPLRTGMTITNGTGISVVSPPDVPLLGVPGIIPEVQAEDDSYVGSFQDNTGQWDMVAFDTGGNVRWIVPNDSPKLATDYGGVIGTSGTTYDGNGNATGQIPLYTQSWTYNLYQDGPLMQIAAMPTLLATSYAFQIQATAAKPYPDSVKANTDQLVAPGREIDYYPFQGNTYWGDNPMNPTATITEYLIKVSGGWPPRGCNSTLFNPNASDGTFCGTNGGTDEKDFDDLISTGFVRRQQMFVQLPNKRNYRVQIYPCTAQNTWGKPVWENQLSATDPPILVNGVAGSTTKRTCHQ